MSCLLVVGLVVFLVVYLTPQEKTEEVPADKDANKTINQPIIYPPIQEDLPISIQEEIQTVHSPSYKANTWMWNDPYRDTYSLDRQKQRFDMAFLYYLTNGDNWFQNDHWLSYTMSEYSNLLKISLASNNLQGTISKIAGYLGNIRVFDIDDNSLHGNVPTGTTNAAMEVFMCPTTSFLGALWKAGKDLLPLTLE
ncbi:unknown protein [Seminavis robusta]|uniref:Uncharacterized protein n=1 Tax=Seminavis robusta TaxID=568900 RepID=A0A9N8HU54_9STRA|nr:unknown protein [Seminavis robusta]|eukprot:Sro1759_g295810.1 n/a (195) ;mRNA; r:9765-10418